MLAAHRVLHAARAATYDAVILADSPLSYWKCDEASGTTLADSGTGGNPLTITGTPTFGQSGIGDGKTAILFNGSTDGTNSQANQSLTGTYTFEAWINPTNVTQTAGTFFGTRGGGSPNTFDVKTAGSTTIHADIGNGTSWINTAADMTGLSLVAGSWYHVVYVVTPTGFTAYLNAVQTATGSWASAAPMLWNAHDANLRVGGGSSSEYFAGKVAKVAAYNYALTATQVSNHYAAA